VEEAGSGDDLDGGGDGRREGVGAQRGPDGCQGSSWRGAGVDPTAVGEAVDAMSRRGTDVDLMMVEA
jgi:hypothetical protein